MQPPRRPRLLRSARGSILLVALLIAALVALALGSYLDLGSSSARLARRTYYHDAALDLAEAGAEEALWSFNQAAAGSKTAWSDWKTSSPSAWRDFTDFDLAPGLATSVKVYVADSSVTAAFRPKIVARASVGRSGEPAVTRLLELTLQRRSHFMGGLVARNQVSFAGSNTSVDSWDSNPDRDPVTPAVPYDFSRRIDHGSVASAEVDNTAVLLNQTAVWGYVATGGPAPLIGVHGSIRGADTPAGVQVDPDRVATDFNADFPAVSAPLDGTTLAVIHGPTLGLPDTDTSWRCGSLSLKGNDTLTILGHVTLVLTAGPGVTALSVVGNGGIVIPAGSSLKLYTAGDIKISGNGVTNLNTQPISFQLWGTTQKPAVEQEIQIVGNGTLGGVIYAPDAFVTLNGNGDIMGSVVAADIRLTGNAAFHYDEALAEAEPDAPLGVAGWRLIEGDESTAVEKFLGSLSF